MGRNQLLLPLAFYLDFLEVLLEVVEFVGQPFELPLEVAFHFVLGLHLPIVRPDVLPLVIKVRLGGCLRSWPS